MFERFSEAVRVALFAARLEVSGDGATRIAPEHLLLGLLQTSGGIAERLLEEVGVNADGVRRSLLPLGNTVVAMSVEVRFGAALQAILETVAWEADAMDSRQITTGHLLLGLLRDEHSHAGRLVREAGLRLNGARPRVQEHAALGPETGAADLSDALERRIRDLGLA